jgi:hypothetical protein
LLRETPEATTTSFRARREKRRGVGGLTCTPW